jgi:uncharacterized protein YrrD
MLWNASALIGYHVHGTDGAFGTVHDLLVDDHIWMLRWLVVDTGNWLPGRKVLIPARALGRPDPASRQVLIARTKEQIENSPDIDTDLPVSADSEQRLYEFYALDLDTDRNHNGQEKPISDQTVPNQPDGGYLPQPLDPNLFSLKSLIGYKLAAIDGGIGHVSDFLIDDRTWKIQCLSLNTGDWWPSAVVLIPTGVIQSIDWEAELVHAKIDQAAVRASPNYQPEETADGSYVETVLTYYGITWVKP